MAVSPAGDESPLNNARKRFCSNWRSLVRASVMAWQRIVCIEIQSVRLYSLSELPV